MGLQRALSAGRLLLRRHMANDGHGVLGGVVVWWGKIDGEKEETSGMTTLGVVRCVVATFRGPLKRTTTSTFAAALQQFWCLSLSLRCQASLGGRGETEARNVKANQSASTHHPSS